MNILLYLSEIIIPLTAAYIVSYGLFNHCHVFEDFTHGAVDGIKTAAGLLPTLLGLLTSASNGLLFDIFKEYGTDSFTGMAASIMMSCSETMLYCLSIYFGSVHITKTRWAIPGSLCAILVGMVASFVLADILT